MFAFAVLLFVVLFIYYFTSSKEGFDPVNTQPSHKVTMPVPVLEKTSKDTIKKEVEPSTLPGQLPVAPYQQIAATSPLPYQDTQLIKANRQQIVSLLELLKGFLAFEAQEISEKSDPSIQLPLTTARSDFHSLQSEVEVLNRNPGIQPTVTMSHLNEISSNLAYLQEQVRLIGAAGTLQGPVYEFTEGFQSQGATPAKVEDLKEFIARIQGEAQRLSASGTTDPLVVARVKALNDMKASVKQIVDQVEKGILSPLEIPIMKSDIDKAFPVLGKPNEPLPQIIKSFRLPAGLANLLPSNVQKDPNTTKEISRLLDKYADQIVNGISATFQVNYTSPNERSIKTASTVDKTGFPSMSDLNNATNAKFIPRDGGMPITDRLAMKPMDAGRGPAHFDWKQRAKEIEDQVKKRGLKQSDYGMMPPNTKVSNDFSWKGYARMICTRLQATMDPSLPETCGCPPMDWKGWRN
jgi:hypothetical protein